MNSQMIGVMFVPLLLTLIWLGAIVYLFVLLGRLVSGVERIAAALERPAGGHESRP